MDRVFTMGLCTVTPRRGRLRTVSAVCVVMVCRSASLPTVLSSTPAAGLETSTVSAVPSVKVGYACATVLPSSNWLLVIARQHTERDIVLPILSVRLSSAGTVSKRMDISSHFLQFLTGAPF